MSTQALASWGPDAGEWRHFPGFGRDGQALHDAVPPERWCISRSDLVFLKSAIHEAIIERTPRHLKPPREQDSFFDEKIGPSMHAAVKLYVKPLTKRAGNMSWALLRHPEGLECDVFITHCWDEGVFEFIDKVLNSWPMGKRGAWCCVFANPQNLDISAMITNPAMSPFAAALRSASHVMAVPTQRTSIYQRVWCVYEAYLAVENDSIVFTAVSPLDFDAMRYVPTVLCIFVAGAFSTCIFTPFLGTLGVLLMLQIVNWPSFAQVINAMGFFVSSGAFVWNLRRCWKLGSHKAFFQNDESSATITIGMFCMRIWVWVVLQLYFCASELDRLSANRARKEASQLHCGYEGVEAAKASVQSDKDRIMEDIGDKVQEVDAHIEVLISAGTSTRCLRAVAALGVDVRGAADLKYANLYMLVATWSIVATLAPAGMHRILWLYATGKTDGASMTGFPSRHTTEERVGMWFVGIVMLLACLVRWFFSDMAERTYIASVLAKIMSLHYMRLMYFCIRLLPEGNVHDPNVYLQCWGGYWKFSLWINAVSLAAAMLGLQRLASIPKVGPVLAQVIGPGPGCGMPAVGRRARQCLGRLGLREGAGGGARAGPCDEDPVAREMDAWTIHEPALARPAAT